MQFFLSYSLFILLNLLVFATAFIITARLQQFHLKDWIKITLSVVVLGVSQIIVSELILGAIGQLNIASVLIFNTVLAIVSACLWGKKTLVAKLPPPPHCTRKELLFCLLFFGAALIIFLLRFFNAAFQIPLEYDNVAYHLPFVTQWFKTGSLFPVYYSAFAGPIGYYPSNIELLDLWLILPFGRDYFINFLNFSVFLLLPLAFYGVARNFKIPHAFALLPALLFLYMPQTFRQMGVSLVDIYFTFLFVVSMYFIQEYAKNKHYADILLFGFSIGLFIGTKYLGIMYSVPLLGIATFLIVTQKKQFWLKPLSILAISTFITGSFWYIRNWIESGNPLFPVDIKVAGIKLFEGYYGLTDKILSYSLAYNVHSWQTLKEFLKGYFQMVGVPGIIIIASIPILLIYSIVLSLQHQKTKKSDEKTRSELLVPILLFAGMLFYGYFYWQSPFTYKDLLPNLRYAMMFLTIGCLAVGWICSRLPSLITWIYSLLFMVIGYNFIALVLFPSGNIVNNDKILIDYNLLGEYLWLFMVFLLTGIVATIAIRSLLYNSKKTLGVSMLGVLLLSGYFFSNAFSQRELLENHFLEIWHEPEPISINRALAETAFWFDEHAPNAAIAYSGFNFHYHFFGSSLQRDVDYININECSECTYKDYKKSPDSIRRDPDFTSWLKNLQIKHKEYLVVAPYAVPGVHSWEYQWAQEHPEIFAKVLEQGSVYTYHIRYPQT